MVARWYKLVIHQVTTLWRSGHFEVMRFKRGVLSLQTKHLQSDHFDH